MMREKIQLNESDITNRHNVNTKHRLGKYSIATTIIAASAGLIGIGAYNLFSGSNFKDYRSLYEFTSASHQKDRCNTQKAFDAQQKMFNYFHTDGKNGISPTEASAIAPGVGLDGQQVQNIIDHKLFYINYSCGTPIGSTQTATKGLLEGSAGIGILVGAAISAGGLTYIDHRRKQDQ